MTVSQYVSLFLFFDKKNVNFCIVCVEISGLQENKEYNNKNKEGIK